MKVFTRIAAVCVVALALLFSSRHVDAGATGGPFAKDGFILPGRLIAENVTLDVGETVITLASDPGLTLTVYDTDGNVVRGVRTGANINAVVNVYRAGQFRIEVRNVGNFRANFRVITN